MNTEEYDRVRLEGLPGREGVVMAVEVATPEQAVPCLIAGESITASCDCGSIAVWFCDDATIRGEAMRYRETIAEGHWETVRDAHDWMEEWWQLLYDPSFPRDAV